MSWTSSIISADPAPAPATVRAARARPERIVVGMSGGVDSAVAALMLKRTGADVSGLFMKNWEDDDDDQYCSTREDLVDVAAVADVIGIDLEVVNFSAEYKERVFSEFLREYAAGRTPNPDVLCNAEIKFRAFLDHALLMGANRIATGHYARVQERDGRWQLLRARDASKDQTYFLYRLQQEQLARTLFPLGELAKTEVRRLAREASLAVHAKRDSTGICFIGERPFRQFLNRYLAQRPGTMRTPEGTAVGEHVGLMFYTIGQRKGIGLGGRKGGGGAAWYVAAKDMARNELIVVEGRDHPLLYSRTVTAGDLTWISGAPPDPALPCGAKTRYRQADAAARIVDLDADSCRLEFDTPQWAVTPGQSLVMYDGDRCLGGGIIR